MNKFKEINTNIVKHFYKIPIIGDYPNSKQVLVGYDIASRLGIKVGDEIIISSPEKDIDFTSPCIE